MSLKLMLVVLVVKTGEVMEPGTVGSSSTTSQAAGRSDPAGSLAL
jgi:hypothetical protein